MGIMKALVKGRTPWDIRLPTSKLRASNCELLLDAGLNTVFYCEGGWIACADGSGENATMSIVARFESK